MNDIYRILESHLKYKYILGAKIFFSSKKQTQNSSHSRINRIEFNIQTYNTVNVYDVWTPDIQELETEIMNVSITHNFLSRETNSISAIDQIRISHNFYDYSVYSFFLW